MPRASGEREFWAIRGRTDADAIQMEIVRRALNRRYGADEDEDEDESDVQPQEPLHEAIRALEEAADELD